MKQQTKSAVRTAKAGQQVKLGSTVVTVISGKATFKVERPAIDVERELLIDTQKKPA